MFGNDGFPTIRHIDDVLPHVEGRTDFAVKRRDGYTAIDYIFAGPDTFDEPIRRECRGIKFGADGKIIARPYHKFFNLGEKPETQPDVVNWAIPHVVLEKLDGSMVHPAIVNDRIVWMTRAGATDISFDAAGWADANGYSDSCLDLLQSGITPIFEWCAPQNQIVLRYPQEKLVLTAMRQTVSGEYLPLSSAFTAVNLYGTEIADLAAFIAHTRDLKDAEGGYVVRFNTGAMLKLKADDYVTRHKARDSILLEKNVLRIVLEGAVDDVIALLSPEDAERLEAYSAEVLRLVARRAGIIGQTVRESMAALGDDRKRFAVEIVTNLNPLWKGPMFAVWAGADPQQSVRIAMLKHCGSQTDVDKMREIIGLPAWNVTAIQEAA
jgi:RNA ligase